MLLEQLHSLIALLRNAWPLLIALIVYQLLAMQAHQLPYFLVLPKKNCYHYLFREKVPLIDTKHPYSVHLYTLAGSSNIWFSHKWETKLTCSSLGIIRCIYLSIYLSDWLTDPTGILSKFGLKDWLTDRHF